MFEGVEMTERRRRVARPVERVLIVAHRCLKFFLSLRVDVGDAENGKRIGDGCMMLRLYCWNVGSDLTKELLSICSMASNVKLIIVHCK